jgi:hypothetical protein
MKTSNPPLLKQSDGVNELSRCTTSWAQIRQTLETEFTLACKHQLPWTNGKHIGNTNKVMYMKLIVFMLTGMADIEWDESSEDTFFNIRCAKIQMEHRHLFDSMILPSTIGYEQLGKNKDKEIPHLTRKRKYSITRQWQTAGFLESIDDDNNLVFSFSKAVHKKQKNHQMGIRTRALSIMNELEEAQQDASISFVDAHVSTHDASLADVLDTAETHNNISSEQQASKSTPQQASVEGDQVSSCKAPGEVRPCETPSIESFETSGDITVQDAKSFIALMKTMSNDESGEPGLSKHLRVVKKWAKIRKSLESDFGKLCPMKQSRVNVDNMKRLLFMKLTAFYKAQMAYVLWDEKATSPDDTFFTIRKVTIPSEYRIEFDGMLLPSLQGFRQKLLLESNHVTTVPSKLMHPLYRLWRISGFNQRIGENNSLILEFSQQKKNEKLHRKHEDRLQCVGMPSDDYNLDESLMDVLETAELPMFSEVCDDAYFNQFITEMEEPVARVMTGDLPLDAVDQSDEVPSDTSFEQLMDEIAMPSAMHEFLATDDEYIVLPPDK